MSINKIEIQDGSGNVYYPKTSIDSVIYSDNTSIGEKIIMLERKLIELKSQLADSINNKTGSSLTSNSTVDEMTVAINSIKTLEQATADANATASNILVDKTAYVNGAKITGTMPNKGAITANLNCGGSYTIPAGYHNGSGKVTANSLASQTSANANASEILTDKTAWVNGSKITGTMPNRGEYQTAGGVGSGDDYIAFNKIPYGYYPQSSNGWAPEIRAKKSAVANHIGLTANKIVAGNTICGITGTATMSSLGGINCKKITNCKATVFLNGTGYYHYLDLSDLSFEPNFIIYNYGSSDSNSHYCNMLMLFDNTWTQLYHAGISGSVTKYYNRIYKIGATYGNTITISAKKIPVTVGNISASTPISLGTVYALKL